MKIITRAVPVILSVTLIILAGCGDEDQGIPNPLQIEILMTGEDEEIETPIVAEEESSPVGSITGRVLFTDSDNQVQAYALSSNEYVIYQGTSRKVPGKNIALFVDFPSNNDTYLMSGGYFQVTDVEPGTHELVLVRTADVIIAADTGVLPEDSYAEIDIPYSQWTVTVEPDRNTTTGILTVPVPDIGPEIEWRSGVTGQEVVVPQEPKPPVVPPVVPTTPTKPITVVAGDWKTAVVVTDDKIHEQQASVEQDGNMFTITAAGDDIWGSADQFTFAYKEVSGDFDVSCTVLTLDGSMHDWSKAGIMAREDLTPGSRNIYIACRGLDDLVTFQQRPAAGNSSSSERITPNGAARPVTIRLTRTGDVYEGGWSLDGGATWNDNISNDGVSTTAPIRLALADPVLLGIAVTSHTVGVMTTAEIEVLSAPFSMAVKPAGKLAAKWSTLKTP